MAAGMKTIPTLVQIRPRDHERYRQLPLFGRLLDQFVPWAFGCGYKIHTVYQQLDAIRHLATWFRRRGRRTFAELSADELALARQRLCLRSSGPRYAWSLRAFFAFLQTQGRLKAPGQSRPHFRNVSWPASWRPCAKSRESHRLRVAPTSDASVPFWHSWSWIARPRRSKTSRWLISIATCAALRVNIIGEPFRSW